MSNATSISAHHNDAKEAVIPIRLGSTRADKYSWFPKLLLQISAALLATILSMVGFWIFYGRSLVTADEVRVIVQDTTPYKADEKLIAQRLNANFDMNKELKISIDNNTDAISKLGSAIAVLGERIRITNSIPQEPDNEQ